MLGDCMICCGMFGSGAGIYTMRMCMAPTEFFEEVVGLRKPVVVGQRVVDAAIQHFA